MGRVEPVMRVHPRWPAPLVLGALVLGALVLGALVLVAGCAAPDPAAERASDAPVTSPVTGGPAGGGPTGRPTTAPPSTPRATATPPDRGSGPADKGPPAPPSPPAGTLRGTVERVGACTVLDTGQRRWGLTGPVANRLATGDRVVVTGTPVPVPADCRRVEVFQAVRVTRTQPA